MGAVSNIISVSVQFGENITWGWLGWILDFINSGVGNAAWTIIIFTLLLKTITFPLDFYSRYKMKKNAVIMEDLKPQLEKIEKQSKGNKQLYQQRIQPLLKKEGYSVGGACLPTLVTLVLFIFVFRGLNSYAAYHNAETFKAMSNLYTIEYSQITEPETINGEENEKHNAEKYLNPADFSDAEYQAAVQSIIDEKLIDMYQQKNPSWLWIKNPWRPDIPYSDGFFNFAAKVMPIPTYDEFIKGSSNVAGLPFTIDGRDTDYARDYYNKVMGGVSDYYGPGNGYYVLAVLAVAVSFLSQLIMQKTQGAQQGQQMGAGMNKFMMIMFPVMMGIFAFSSTSVFTLYIITNSTTSLLATLAINFLVGRRLAQVKLRKESQIGYRRKG